MPSFDVDISARLEAKLRKVWTLGRALLPTASSSFRRCGGIVNQSGEENGLLMKTRTSLTTNLLSRPLSRCGLMLTALALIALTSVPAECGTPSVRRAIGVSPEGTIWQRPNETGQAQSDDLSIPLSPPLTTVDTDLYTGYENAIYATDDKTVFIAYKRFLSDPTVSGYIPAELRIAKSTDSGHTWAITVVDANAIEEGDTIDNSVSIDGDHQSTIYVAYYTRASGLFADTKLSVAKSTDGGSTWTMQTVASGSGGDYNSIRVLNAKSAILSAHADGVAEGIHAFITDNGKTWSDTLLAGGLGNGLYTSVGAADSKSIWVSYYNSLYPDHTDMNAGKRTSSGSWKTVVLDGTSGDSDLTGIGSSITVNPSRTVFTAYEADTSSGAFVRVASTTNGKQWNVVPVQQDVTIGWNTAIHEFNGKLYVSYWRVPVGSRGQAMFAVSGDNGATWIPFAIQDPRYVTPYIDSTAPTTFYHYESYQTIDPSTFDQPVLRVARIGN